MRSLSELLETHSSGLNCRFTQIPVIKITGNSGCVYSVLFAYIFIVSNPTEQALSQYHPLY